MINTPANSLYKKQGKTLLPATFKKAVISSVNIQRRTANVYIVGSSQTIIQNIPVSRSIDVTKVNQGDKCKVDCFDESNPSDMVVAYTY
jgi:hypothetical protein